MFGFIFGTACLIGLYAVARRGRHHYGHAGCHGRRGYGARFLFRRVLDRLDTTPGQEKVIRSAVNELEEEAWGLRREARATRAEIADALRGAELDQGALDRVFAKHDELIEKLRASFVRTADRVHGTLDERQRKQLAQMIDAGPWGLSGC
jgi:hypothetical protein